MEIVLICDRILELRRVPARELRSNPKNWRRHSDPQRRALRAMLDDVGFAGAALARQTSDGLELIDGHLRAHLAADGMIPVLVLDVDEAEADRILATLDPLSAMAEADSDALARLLAGMTIPSQDATVPWINQRSSDRITALLDLMDWPSADRDVRTGIATLDFVRGGLGSILEHAQKVAATELGAFYVGADGKIRFDDRYANIQGAVAANTFGDAYNGIEVPYSALEPVYDTTDLWTEVQAAREGGAVRTSQSSAAKAEFGTRVLPWAGMWIDDEQPKAVADKLLAAYKSPTLRFRSIELNGATAPTWVEMLSRDLNRDRFVVKRRPPGGGSVMSQEVVIEGIEHEIRSNPKDWKTVWRLATADAAATYHVVGTTLLTTGTAGLAN